MFTYIYIYIYEILYQYIAVYAHESLFGMDWKLTPWQDFATQVHFWTAYRDACDRAQVPYQRIVSPELAEHMSGQILKTSQK